MFRKQVVWKKTFVLWPRRCALSDQWLWMTTVYKGTRTITGPGTPVIECYWIEPKNFLLATIKGIVQ